MGSYHANNPSPEYGANTGCLCRDRQTYSPECCDGSLMAQGIGTIYRNPEQSLKLIEATLANESKFSQSVFKNVPLTHIRIFNVGQDILSAFTSVTKKGSTLYFPYPITGKVYGFLLPTNNEIMTNVTIIDQTLAGSTTISDPSFEGKELKAIHLFNSGQHITTAMDDITLVGDTLQLPYPITGAVDGFVFG